MNQPKLLGFLFLLPIFGFAPAIPHSAAQSPDHQQLDCSAGTRQSELCRRAWDLNAALNSVEKYCWDVEKFSEWHEPRLFAETHSGEGQIGQWMEFSGKAEWKRAGKPKPAAWVWNKDGNIIQVAMAFDDNENGGAYAVYSYRANGHLAKLRSVPTRQTTCDDAYFSCHITLGRGMVYLPDGQKVGIIDAMDGRLLQSEKTSTSFSKFIPPEYLNVSALPFSQLLYSEAVYLQSHR